jgi:2-polyprenyl-3-methyl-5-hydroxy-6-metoxy-1,4-benzoquinol methylase
MTVVTEEQGQRVSRFFTDFAETWDTLYGGRRGAVAQFLDARFRRDIYERYEHTFAALRDVLRGKSVLDIGCGSGIYCAEAARLGANRVVGLDVSSGMVDLARQRYAGNNEDSVCEFICAPFPPRDALRETFDYGIVMGVMDYVADPVPFLTALRQHVRDFAILSFPGRHWLREPVRRARYRLLGRCEIYGYDEAQIREACRVAGFGRVDIVVLPHSGICYIVRAYASGS